MMDRKVLILLVATVATSIASGKDGSAPVVATEEGRVLGMVEESTKGRTFNSYYSIPFAKPPQGRLRYKDPVPASSWDGILDTSSPPPMCLQLQFTAFYTGNTTVLGEEDCLYVSVFTHEINVDKPKPVMVYIHGGGFYAGSSSKHPPHVLMNEDIVLVMLQYRLGILGFLTTEDNLIPGNFGLKDQTEALRWVQRNIRHFGGDPSRVTIFGESAGSASTHYQLLTPKARGLFTRAILQSGTALCSWAHMTAPLKVAKHTAELFNCSVDRSPDMLRCLQEAPGQELVLTLLDSMEWLFSPMMFVPYVDGDYLPDDPNVLMKDGDFSKVDIISGVTAHDGGLGASPMYAYPKELEALVNNFSRIGPLALDFTSSDYLSLQSAQTIFSYYLGGTRVDQANPDDVVKMFTQRHFSVCHDLTTLLHARNNKEHRTFRYELEYRGQHSATDLFPLDFTKHWVSHTDDLYYLFTGNIWYPITNPRDLKLRDILTKLWANFAATGDPTPDESLGFKWDSSSESNLSYLSLSPSPVMKMDNRMQVREFFATLPTHQNEVLQGRYPTTVSSPATQRDSHVEMAVGGGRKLGSGFPSILIFQIFLFFPITLALWSATIC